jgi:16S rRNA (uracil1498-N3)-methyltransferase
VTRKLRVPLAPLVSGQAVLDEATGRYVARVHRLRVGDSFVGFDPEAGTEASCTVENDRLPDVLVSIGEVSPTPARPSWDVTLLQAVGKGDKPDQVVRDATVLGARRVVLVHTERTVARAEGAHKRERERRIAVEAARQSGRGDVPEILGPLAIEDALDSAALGGAVSSTATKRLGLVLCFREDSEPLLTRLTAWQAGQSLSVLVGPEGGFSSGEVEQAVAAGFLPTSLGAFVLRTETAATVALGVVQCHAIAAFSRDDGA